MHAAQQSLKSLKNHCLDWRSSTSRFGRLYHICTAEACN
jgi:hypothetical protein